MWPTDTYAAEIEILSFRWVDLGKINLWLGFAGNSEYNLYFAHKVIFSRMCCTGEDRQTGKYAKNNNNQKKYKMSVCFLVSV